MQFNFYIYALFCDKTDDIVYVGMTQDPYWRQVGHKSSCKKDKRPLYKYFRKNKSIPRMEIIEVVRAEYRSQRVNDCERYWMHVLLDYGFNIQNQKWSIGKEIKHSILPVL